MENKSSPTPLWQIAACGACALGFLIWLDVAPRSGDIPENPEQAPAIAHNPNQDAAQSESELQADSSTLLPNASSESAPPNPYDPAVLSKQLEQIVGTDPENQAKQLAELQSLKSRLYLEQVAASSRAQQSDSESTQSAEPEQPQSEPVAANDSTRTNPYAELQAKVPTQSEEELREQRALRGSSYLELTKQPPPEVGGR